MASSYETPSRPPNDRERDVFAKRKTRVELASRTRTVAVANLRALAAERDLTTIRVRQRFIRLDSPIVDDTSSDRTAPPHERRPPCTRLFSPNGIALQLVLIALFEAQRRTLPGERANPTPIPLRAESSGSLGWTKLVSTPAGRSGAGKHLMSVSDKQIRQLKNALTRLEAEGLIEPADPGRRTNRYEKFYLMYEDVLFGQANELYRVPEDSDEFFEVPVELFTNGWVHVLEDSELALLLIAIYKRQQVGDIGYKLPAGTRALHFGLGRDSFDAHLMLERLGLIDVTPDPDRITGGMVLNYREQGAEPHALRFLPDGLARDAGEAVLEVLDHELGR